MPAPSLTLDQRVYRLGSGFGPMSGLRSDKGAPAVPGGGGGAGPLPVTALFDWDPAAGNPFADQVGPYPLEVSAGGATLVTNRGLIAMLCDGTGGLITPTANYGEVPFASLDDVTGDRVTMYLVCERTDSDNSGSQTICAMDNTESVGSQTDCMGMYWVGSNDAVVGLSGDDGVTEGQNDIDTAARDAVEVIHFEVGTTSTIGVGINGAAPGPTTLVNTPHVPTGMNRIAIGGGGIFNEAENPWSLAGGLKGYVYRFVICEGAYDQDVQDYLAAAYTNLGAAPTSRVLFDFDPAFSMTQDRVGGIALTDPVGGVARVVANGRIAAEFDGTNYLLGASSPFAALSDLTGGVSIYVMAEPTNFAGGATQGMVSLWKTAESGTDHSIQCSFAGTEENGILRTNDGTLASVARPPSDSSEDMITSFGYHSTLTARTMTLGAPASADANVNSVDPAGMNRVTLGDNSFGGAPTTQFFTGRIYRVLVCEGAFSQEIADYLASLYTPVRIPPMVDPSTIRFLFDPRSGLYRDLTKGVTLAPNETPSRVSRGGDVAMFCDGNNDWLDGVYDSENMDEDFTWYCVVENSDPLYSGIVYMNSSLDPTGQRIGVQMRSDDVANTGVWITSKSSSAVNYYSGEGTEATVGKIHLVVGEKTPTGIQGWIDGAQTNGQLADTREQTNLDQVRFGSWHTNYMDGYIWYVLGVKGSTRDTDVEAWINATFPVGETP